MKHPNIDDAPGLAWRPLKQGWQASWRARADLIARGYTLKYRHLWLGSKEQPEPSAIQIAYIQEQCEMLQAEMLTWGRGGTPIETAFDKTWRSLIVCYQTDKHSNYRNVRHFTRRFYDKLCQRIDRDRGSESVQDFKVRNSLAWHQEWSASGHIPLAHALMGMVRTLVNFGADFLEDEDCVRIAGILHRRRFKQGSAREAHLGVDQVVAVRAEAHKQGRPSIALAQAFQFECTFRQKDCIGEWVPIAELGLSTVTHGQEKWLRGIRWEEIDTNMILRHVTSKRQKEVFVDLRNAPMVIEELGTSDRSALPASGPIIISETTQRPWSQHEFRRIWRKLADAAGIPRSVRNMDSRAGAITEALNSGARLQSVRKAATHSTEAMTQRYSRDDANEIADVMKMRVAGRNKPGKGAS